MNQLQKIIRIIREEIQNNPRRLITILLYWSVATLLLIGAVITVFKVISPNEAPSPTPNLTTTLQQALNEALGPIHETPLPVLTITPAPTLQSTLTPFPSLTPTITPSPFPTPTQTNTPLLATLTPALPSNINDAFIINPLSAEGYDVAITRMEVFPELLPDGNQNINYYPSFYPATVLSYEALLQYPQAAQAPNWRWRLASHLTKIGDKRANIMYAGLITRALNNQGVSIDNLPDWVKSQDPHQTLKIQPVNPIGGNPDNKILEIQNPGGSLFLWLVISENRNQVFALNDEIDYQNPYPSNLIWGDVNQDNFNNLIIFTPGSETRKLYFPKVFNLTLNPPQELRFKPNQSFDIGLESEYEWKAITNEEGFYDLQMSSTVYPPCLLKITQSYRWTGQWIELVSSDYEIQPISQLLGYCELLIEQASTTWGLPAAIQVLEQILPLWPPASTSEKTYSLDEVDQLRYRLGVYHTLTKNYNAARAYFNEIIQTPAVPGSRWITPAREFLENLDTPKDIYNVCIKSEYCDPRIALMIWIESLSSEDGQNILYHLINGGISIRFTDQFDFEGDRSPERWFTIRHRALDRLEFWILINTPQGAQALFVDTVDSNQPQLTRYTNLDGQSYVWIGSQQSFRLVRNLDPIGTTIELLPPSYYYSDLTNQISRDALNRLTAGFTPKLVLSVLQEHLDSEFFTCLSKEDCARFYYALGLAAELSGENDIAIDAYLKIWWDSFESPFSTIARMKLAYKPGYGPIVTATSIPTLRFTITPTPTATLTFTPSNTPDPNATVTVSPTATNTPDTYP